MRNTILSIIAILLVVAGVVYLLKSNPTPPDTTTLETNQSPIVSDDNSEPNGEVSDLPVEPAAAEARKDLATKLSVSENSIVILKITEETWTDGCLGLGGPAESCLQALVPGFRVEMIASGKTYFYRTDKTGATVRAEAQ